MTNNGKTVGENKLEKLVRLLNRYQDQVELNDGFMSVTIRADNTAALFIMPEPPNTNTTVVRSIYSGTPNDVIEFLESGELKRTLMVRG